MIRTFIAVEMPADVRAALRGLVERMAPRWPERGVRWVKGDSMHLTLRFLGDTDEALVPELRAGLDEVAEGAAPFELRLNGTGCFPNPRRPRVIWVGLDNPEDRLLPLQKQVERLARACGWERERRPFRPHLTLGRVRDRTRPPQGDWLVAPEEVVFRVEKVQLIESHLKPTGAEYAVLHTARLAGT